MTPATAEPLPGVEYERVFAVLDHCAQARDLTRFKHLLMDALHTHYGFPNTTFLAGHTFRNAFADPDPVVTGRITPILDEYHSGWYRTDMFSAPESFAALSTARAITHTQLRSLPSTAVEYMDRFLYRRQLHSAAVMHLGLADDAHALVGIFDSAGREVPPQQVRALGLLAGQLSTFAKTLPGGPVLSWRERLSPRQQELAELLADGLTNEEIAAALRIEVDSVKKYVSRIFTITRVRNRVELAKLVYTERLAQ
ncbi:helix-turn-helix transcriptional regulator [Gordonia sp. NB41Y]|uniref:helix-turn-helix transcriptional regulator n=1 Tax=Gordonia sp. NB41Y TaxID=875808 RepID=UPI0002BF7A6F|nr:helix-turn-helix transcriptional regulator [Gordonia sp. NB41Y]EMP11641.1 LuxR family transcriptional regulator [Gordonia sp. NB41Y]WLP92840.1 helix-turn-helix transcriptional regulator [Gordonia sp. NB41Y]